MSRKMKLDFTGVESYQKASEGQHVAKIATAEVKESQGGNDMIVVAFEVTKGSDKGSRVYENYSLVDAALWKLKGMLQAIGMKCEGKIMLDLDKMIGKTCIIDVIHDEYNGQTRARIQECRKLSAVAEDDEDVEDEADDEEEEDEAPKKKATKKPQPKSAPKKKLPINEPEDDDEDDDWDEEDDEEEDEAPKKPVKKAAPAKKPAKKAASKKTQEPEDEDDDDDDWDEE